MEFPEKYYAQCVHYLAVTGATRWYLAVLVYGRGFFTFTLERDQTEIDALMGAERDFWKLVEQGSPPALDGLEPTGNALQRIYPISRGGDIHLFGREQLLSRYFELQSQKKEILESIGAIENTIKADMGEAERGDCGIYSVSWKSQTRQIFQPQEFARAHPEIDLAPFYKQITARPFKVKVSEVEKNLKNVG